MENDGLKVRQVIYITSEKINAPARPTDVLNECDYCHCGWSTSQRGEKYFHLKEKNCTNVHVLTIRKDNDDENDNMGEGNTIGQIIKKGAFRNKFINNSSESHNPFPLLIPIY